MPNKTLGSNFVRMRKRIGMGQEDIAAESDFSARTIARWEAGEVPREKNLRDYTIFLSKKLDISPEKFQYGKLLLKKDFEDLLAERFLREPRIPYDVSRSGTSVRDEASENLPNVQEFTTRELELISFLRELKFGSRYTPLSEATVNRIKETMDIIGVDDPVQLSFLKFVSVARRRYGNAEQGRGPEKETEG